MKKKIFSQNCSKKRKAKQSQRTGNTAHILSSDMRSSDDEPRIFIYLCETQKCSTRKRIGEIVSIENTIVYFILWWW